MQRTEQRDWMKTFANYFKHLKIEEQSYNHNTRHAHD